MLINKIKTPLAFWLFFWVFVSEAANIENISVAELPGERVEIKVQFDGIPDLPAGYTIDSPARIVLDFVGAGNNLDKKKFPIAVGDVSSTVVVTGGGRTRVIVNLDTPVPYLGRIDGSTYIVEIGAGLFADASSQESASVSSSSGGPDFNGGVSSKSEMSPDYSSSVSSIDFRRGEVGEGRVIIDLTNPKVAVDMEEVGNGINVKFIDTFLPSELKRTLDVLDFATPVKSFAASTSGSDTNILISTSGEYDYLAYQTDNRYVISIKPLTEQELEEKLKKFAYVGETLSLNFQDIEVRSVLQLIADFTELNLVASDTVSGRITLRLDNVPWDQALDLVLKTKGLDKRQVGNVLMVAPAAEIAAREKQEIETKKQLQELAPLRTEYLRIRYANAAELFKLFVNQSGSGNGGSTATMLSERGQAIVDERTNSIILTDTSDKIEEFKVLVERIDIPIRQVMIEARIVRANDDFRRELGINLNASGSDTSPSGATLNAARAGVNAGFAAPTGTFGWDIINADFLINLELLALEEVGLAEIVSQPKVITGDKQAATIESGTEVAYQEESASGGTTTQFKEVLLKLEVTPQITPDGRVIMDLDITQDNVASITATGIPVLDVTGLSTQVLVSNGETVVLGGVYQTETVDGERKVPVLGDIPLLGKLFRSDVMTENKSELLIFITPRIMDSIYAD